MITLKNNIALVYLLSENDEKDKEEVKRDNEMSTDVITSDKLICEVCHRDFPTRTAYENHGCINQIITSIIASNNIGFLIQVLVCDNTNNKTLKKF